MKKLKWLFLSNVFRRLASRSMVRFSKFCHVFMLGLASNTTDPFFADKHQELFPFIEAFNASYDMNYNNFGQRKGDVKRFKQLYRILTSTKLHTWDIALQAVYQANTPEYTKILPNGFKLFHVKSTSDRMTYFKNAVTEIGNYPNLNALHNEMNLFYLELTACYDVKQKKSTNIKESTSDLKTLAIALADEIYGVLGDFMKKFRKDPDKIRAYFPIFLLRYRKKGAKPDPDIFTRTVNANTIIEAGLNFGHNDSMNLYDTGNTGFDVWFTPDPTAPKPEKVLTFLPQDVKVIKVSDYAIQADRFMMIENTSINEEGTIEISFN